MSDSTGRYIGDTDGSARTWRDDEILGGWNAEENKGTQSAQFVVLSLATRDGFPRGLQIAVRVMGVVTFALVVLSGISLFA